MRNRVRTGIEFGNWSFPLWDAAIAAGATLDELEKLDEGGYSRALQIKLLAWHEMSRLVSMHVEDARARATDKMERRRRKG